MKTLLDDKSNTNPYFNHKPYYILKHIHPKNNIK